ncbi:hypothetical protein GF406_27105 [candidate division KSB1 bacterium]|nr:hypothetical protein [candidate division KSB1 bacterium]
MTAAGIAFSSSLLTVQLAANSASPRPSPAQVRWKEAEIGLIYHFDLPIAARRFASNNSLQEVLDPNLYQPKKLGTDQWLEAAKAAVARYAIFTVTAETPLVASCPRASRRTADTPGVTNPLTCHPWILSFSRRAHRGMLCCFSSVLPVLSVRFTLTEPTELAEECFVAFPPCSPCSP